MAPLVTLPSSPAAALPVPPALCMQSCNRPGRAENGVHFLSVHSASLAGVRTRAGAGWRACALPGRREVIEGLCSVGMRAHRLPWFLAEYRRVQLQEDSLYRALFVDRVMSRADLRDAVWTHDGAEATR